MELLGRHVRGRAAGGLAVDGEARETEIDEHDAFAVVLGNDDRVRRLDVRVDETGIVRRAEPGEQLAYEIDRAHAWERSVGEDLLEIAAVEQLHRVEQPAVVRDVGLVDAHDVRVIDATDGADLVDEQTAVVGSRIDVGVQDLDRDVALDRELVRAIHGAERAARDEPCRREIARAAPCR